MKTETGSKTDRGPSERTMGHRLVRGCALGCAGAGLLLVAAIVLLMLFVGKVPESYPLTARPIPPDTSETKLGGGLDGFESPYLTGELYGYYHALIGAVPALAPRLRFYPDWTGQSFAGSARLSLAIPMYALLYRTGLMICRIPIVKTIRLVREHKKGAAYAK